MNTHDRNPGHENPTRSGLAADNDYRQRMTERGQDSGDDSEKETDDTTEIVEKHSEWGDVDPQHNSNSPRSGIEPSGPGSAV